MEAEILEFVPVKEHTPTEEDYCSFCGIDKTTSEKGRLIAGPEAMVCITCLRQMRVMLLEGDGGLVA